MKPCRVVVACALGIAISSICSAVELRSGSVIIVPKRQIVKEDVLAGAKNVTIEPEVKGDVAAAGQSVTVSGPVRNSAMLLGQGVDLIGTVGNDAWLAGQNVKIGSTIADNAYVAGANVTLTKDGSVGRDLLVGGGDVLIHGTVGRDLRVAADELIIGGVVTGNVYAQAQTVRLLETALVKGNLWYESPYRLMIAPGAKVMGKIEHRLPPKEKVKPVFWSHFAWWMGKLIAAVIFGATILAVFPNRSSEAAAALRRSFWFCLGIGLVVAIVTPTAIAIGLMTLVGIPLAVAVLFAYITALYAAGIFASLALGTWILGRGRTALPKTIGSMILGAIIFGIVFLIPVAGWLAKLVVTISGLGAFCVSWWRSRMPSAVDVNV
ncbi:MAG: hypothetical protein N3B12_03215 [Armatimonadetes bacterium]|nr:hypothetical protein [Armatimonadota bacterium]